MKVWALILTLVFATAAQAAPQKTLEKELKELDEQEGVASAKVQDRLYAMQMRATPIAGRFEALVAAGQTFSGTDFLDSSQFGVEGQYHIDDRWAVAAAYSHVNNRFTSSAHNLENQTGYLPDVDYARSRLEARAQFNVFYGKFRFTRAQALGFDQYLGLGLAYNDLRSGGTVGFVADAGFAFWLGPKFSLHLGVKDYNYRENRTLSKGDTNNVQAYAQAGILF